MKKSDFYFELPEELIAQTPLEKRDSSRLLHLDKVTGEMEHRHFYDCWTTSMRGTAWYSTTPGAARPAHRSPAQRRQRGAGAAAGLGEGRWECLSRPGRKTKPGTEIHFGDGELKATVEAVAEGGNRIVRFDYEGIFLEVLERLGKMPLPPYIKEELEDGERYQTVYSREVGSAAAPTAGTAFHQGADGEDSRQRCEAVLCHPPRGPGHLPAGEG